MRRTVNGLVRILFACLFLLILSPGAFAEVWKDDALAAEGAASRLLSEARKAETLQLALNLLEPNAPRLPGSDEKREVLSYLARLKELAGDLEGASEAWMAAADAGPYRSDAALVEAARCLVSLGETERAAAGLRIILLTGRDPVEVRRARYLSVQLAVFRGESDGLTLLKGFLEGDDYRDRQASTLYLLFVMTGDESWRSSLLTLCPASPEARLLSDGKRPDAVSLKASPLWLLFPGRASIALSPPQASGGLASVPHPAAPASGATPAATQPPAPEATSGPAMGTVYQVGLFRREANARELAKRLGGKGFSVHVDSRQVSGQNYWVVTVDGGKNPSDTALRLKDEGIESFPL